MKVYFKPLQARLAIPEVRWVVTGIVLFILLAIVLGLWLLPLRDALWTVALGAAFALILYLVAHWYIHLKSELVELQARFVEIDRLSGEAKRRVESVLQLSRKFVEANDEEEVIGHLLETVAYLSGSIGASIVPLDEHGQPLMLFRFGELPEKATDAWLEYLASPEVRSTCLNCQNTGQQIHGAQACPLIGESIWPGGRNGGFPGSVYCLPLRRGSIEYGVLNLFLAPGRGLEPDFEEFLRILLAETVLALEGLRLKNRERSAFQQLQTVRRQNDLANLLMAFLENVRETFKSNLVVLSLKPADGRLEPIYLEGGQIPDLERAVIATLLDSVFASGQPMLIADMGNPHGGRNSLRSMVAAPVGYAGEQVVGVLLTGNFRPQSLNSRHLALIRSFSEQVNLVVQNVKVMAEVEFNTMISERNRLAREIHDGLAQTLGFLKLQTAQMQNFLTVGNIEGLEQSLATSYKVLAEAYLDARQAIEGLRISPGEEELIEWLELTVLEFQENSGIPVSLETDCNYNALRPEVQAQLIRIVQEALSNIRKHADASHAWITCQLAAEELILELRDDGCGFNPEDVPSAARYGLRGMRERSDLIGADLEIISRPHEGTIVRICYPAPVTEFEA